MNDIWVFDQNDVTNGVPLQKLIVKSISQDLVATV